MSTNQKNNASQGMDTTNAARNETSNKKGKSAENKAENRAQNANNCR